MSTLHTVNAFNVEASLNAWFNTQMNAITKPSWLPSLAIAYIVDEDTPIITPGVSVSHLPVGVRQRWQGGHVGQGNTGGRAAALMDVSCWASRHSSSGVKNNLWTAQLMTLRSMVQAVFAGKASLQLSDYWSNTTAPDAVAYKVDFRDLEAVDTAHDPNPDIERGRYLIRYDYTVRSTI